MLAARADRLSFLPDRDGVGRVEQTCVANFVLYQQDSKRSAKRRVVVNVRVNKSTEKTSDK